LNENNNAVVQSAGEETPQVSPPQTEVESSTQQTPTEQQPVVVEQNELDDPREFQNRRLAEDNRKLKAELEAKAKNESAFDVFRPRQAPVAAPTGVNIYDYVDQESGTVDWNSYNGAVNNAIAQTQQVASYTAQQTTREIIDEQTARTKYPEVFANPELEEQAASMYLFAKMQGRDVSVSDIAAKIARGTSKAIAQAEKAGAEKILSEVSEKEAASLQASTQTSAPARQAASADQLERLRQQSRGRGRESDEAVAVRMSAIGWRGQK
jgi:hypothetical protein